MTNRCFLCDRPQSRSSSNQGSTSGQVNSCTNCHSAVPALTVANGLPSCIGSPVPFYNGAAAGWEVGFPSGSTLGRQRDRMTNSRNKLAHVRCLLSPDSDDDEVGGVRARSRTEGANGKGS